VIKEVFTSNGWEIEKESWSNPIYKSDDSEIVQKLLGVYRFITGDHSPAYCIGGGTYAKDIPNILAFGAEKQGAEHHIHGADEYIGLEQMVECAYIYAEAMKALAE
jgi:succinyl-diaminopimelate desuccinylase